VPPTPELNADAVLATLARVAGDGAKRAGRAVSGLLGQDVRIEVPSVRLGTRTDAAEAMGGPEAIILGSYLAISGDVTGHVLLLFPATRALECVDLMCGLPRGTMTTPDEVAESAIGELGNVVGSAFVNALADDLNLVLHPTPPAFLHDMAGAVLQTLYAEVLAQDGEVAILDTVFADPSGQVAGILIVAPDPVCLGQLERAA
jgi:chemotaxis protein CheC